MTVPSVRVGTVRLLGILLVGLAAAHAPLQCSREPDAELRREETPPEALADLARRFKEQGNDAARRETLRYLVERYPNSRFAAQAREELGGRDAGAAGRR